MVWESSALAASGTTHHSFAWRRRLDGSVDGMPREGLLGCCRIEVSKSLPNPALSLPWDSATDQLPALPACLAANSLPSSLSCPMPPMELLIGAGCGCPAHSAAAIRDPVSREPIRLQYPAVGLAKVGRRSIGAAGGGLPPVHAAGPCLSVTCTPALPTPVSASQSLPALSDRPDSRSNPGRSPAVRYVKSTRCLPIASCQWTPIRVPYHEVLPGPGGWRIPASCPQADVRPRVPRSPFQGQPPRAASLMRWPYACTRPRYR